MTTNPQSEVKCCERCNRFGCAGDQCSCPCHHPKESPVSQTEPKCLCEADGFQGAISTVHCPVHNDSVSQSVEGREAELKKLYEETNIKALVEEMEKDAEEYGQYHDDDCPLNREGGSDFGDVCECEKIRALKTLAREWMGKVNRMWVANVQNHRKHCSPRGNKELTKIKDKINGSKISRTLLSTLVKEMEGLKVEESDSGKFTRKGFNAGISAAIEVVNRLKK